MIRNRSRLVLALAAAMLLPTLAAAADPAAHSEEGKKETPAVPAAPAPAVTHHEITIDGAKIPYTATAATIDLQNDDGDTIGRMFYVAYTRDGVSDPATRPVTFCFNGGPGSSTMWLEMASFGPKRVEVTDAAPTPPPPYRVVVNGDSLLDVTDLVFVDAMGTGYSRIVGKGKPKDFYGTDPDVASFAQFIQRWLGKTQRWASPKFLLGESYGTTRAAGLLASLEARASPSTARC